MSSISTLRIGTWNVAYANLVNNPRRLEILHAADFAIVVNTATTRAP